MAFGQPFYNYGANNYGAYNNGYVAPQPQPNYLYNNNQGMAQNGNQQPLNAFQQQSNAQQAQQPIQQAVIPAKTNIAPVASLVDAMSRTSEPNTNFYYADQENPFIYLISIDVQGRKTYKTFKIEDVTEQMVETPTQASADIDLSGYATKEDLKAFKEEMKGYAMNFLNAQPTATPAPTVMAKPKTSVKKEEPKE